MPVVFHGSYGVIEVLIEEVYVIDSSYLSLREGFYERREWIIHNDIGYDPDWYLK